MMRRLKIQLTALFLSALLCAPALAALKGEDLEKQVVMTEKASLLSQVDAVSLYMTSEKAAFAPRLLSDNVIEVEVTVLDKTLLANRQSLESFVKRRIVAFNSVLKERLPVFAPSVAKSFDENKDIRFVVNATSARQPVAICSGDSWKWDAGFKGVATQAAPIYIASAALPLVVPEYIPEPPNEPAAEPAAPKGKLGCNCPARKKQAEQ